MKTCLFLCPRALAPWQHGVPLGLGYTWPFGNHGTAICHSHLANPSLRFSCPVGSTVTFVCPFVVTPFPLFWQRGKRGSWAVALGGGGHLWLFLMGNTSQRCSYGLPRAASQCWAGFHGDKALRLPRRLELYLGKGALQLASSLSLPGWWQHR